MRHKNDFSLEELQSIYHLVVNNDYIDCLHPLAKKISKLIEQEKIATLHQELIVLSNN